MLIENYHLPVIIYVNRRFFFFCSLYILRDKLSCFYYISTFFFALRYMYYVYRLCLLWLKNGGKYVLRWESRVSIKLSYLLIKNIGKGVQLKQL